MGRKIPGKRHHGVKDPEKQKQEREKLIKNKINSAPKNLDDQVLPKKLKLLLKAKEDAKAPRKRVKKPKSTEPSDPDLLDSSKHMGYEMRLPGMKKPLKSVPVFKQEPGESEKKFFQRMERTVQSVIKRKEYEEKYNVDVFEDEEGKTIVKDREKDEVEEEMDKVTGKKKAKRGVPVKSKEEKRKIKRLKEKERRLKKRGGGGGKDEEEEKDFTSFKDSFEFNETVHAPPSLNKFKNVSRRPGENKALLLKKNLEGSRVTKVKKPTLSMAKKVMLSEEREKVIAHYRSMKDAGNKKFL